MDYHADEMLARLRATFDAAGIPVVEATFDGDRTFSFDAGGLLSEEQQQRLSAACNEERVKIDVNTPTHRYVVDGRVPRP